MFREGSALHCLFDSSQPQKLRVVVGAESPSQLMLRRGLAAAFPRTPVVRESSSSTATGTCVRALSFLSAMSSMWQLLSGAGSGRAASPSGIVSGRGSDDIATLTSNAVPITTSGFPQALAAIVASIPESADVVCIGESTHGTKEFYQMRAEITKALIAQRGFASVVLESDFPDTSLVDAHAKGIPLPKESGGDPLYLFGRFPQWMWRNETMRDFSAWLKDYNQKQLQERGGAGGAARHLVGIAGMDLYSLFASADEVISYLETVDKEAAAKVRTYYACLDNYDEDPQTYAQSVTAGWSKSCADGVMKALTTLYEKRADLIAKGGLVLEEAKRKAQRAQKRMDDEEQGQGEEDEGEKKKESGKEEGETRPSGQPSQPFASLYPPSDPAIIIGPHGPRLHHEVLPLPQPGASCFAAATSSDAAAGAGVGGGAAEGSGGATSAGAAENLFLDPSYRQFSAELNAAAVKDAEAYYRGMFSTRVNTWNARDSHMVRTIRALQDFLTAHPASVVAAAASSSSSFSYSTAGVTALAPGQLHPSPSEPKAKPEAKPKAKLVVWAHNSHLGDASATESWTRQREHNVGMLLRQELGRDKVFLLGQYTASGTVTAASYWDGPAERKTVRPPLAGSYEDLLQRVPLPAFYLGIRGSPAVKGVLTAPRLQRAIGVIYKPATERQSHYFESCLANQYDGLVFFRESNALVPLEKTSRWKGGEEESFPSGL